MPDLHKGCGVVGPRGPNQLVLEMVMSGDNDDFKDAGKEVTTPPPEPQRSEPRPEVKNPSSDTIE